jgi:hypothetical protein
LHRKGNTLRDELSHIKWDLINGGQESFNVQGKFVSLPFKGK